MKEKNKLLVIAVIILLAIFLRLFKLNEVPIELFGDEIDVGLQAHSILTTGKDYLGNSFPVMFQSFEERRLPGFIYSAVPFIGIFGLNEWGVRLNGVFWGILGILGIYLLGQKLFNYKVGIASMALLSFSPWHLQYSRQAGIESGMLFAVICFSLWSFLKGLTNYKWLVASTVLFALSFYTYAISSLFVTLLGISLLIIYRKQILKYGFLKMFILGVIAFLILLPFISLTFQGKSTERTSKISIFADKDLNDEIVTRRKIEGNSFDARFWHNKGWVFSEKILANYFHSLSVKFLFFEGDPNLRHSYDKGLLYLFQMILILFGAVFIIRKKANYALTLTLLFISPIPSAITIDGGFHASRLIILLLPLTILSGLGLNFILENVKDKKYQILIAFVGLLAVINLSYYFHRYYNDWARDSWRFWQSGYKEAISYVKTIDKDYSKVYFNNTYESTLPRFLFWYGYDIKKFQTEYSSKPSEHVLGEVYKGFTVGEKYNFGRIDKNDKYAGLDQTLKPGELYMVSSRDEASEADWRISPPGNLTVLKTVVNPYNKPIFYIVKKK
jgi:4-amino-4-deoxy-L-arabinose transferase-like glycosyltransferase